MSKKEFFCRFTAIFQIAAFLFAFSPKTPAQNYSDKSELTVFSNSAPITINTNTGLIAPTVASVYPSPITVSGMSGTITKVEVSLKGLTHNFSNDLDFLLVSPTGAKYIFLSDVNAVFNDSFFTFSDTGATVLGSGNASGTYLPTNVNSGTDTFPAPAPAAPYNTPPTTFAATFNGADPNGVWNLYAVDDALFNTGYLISGWSLNITTTGAPQTFSNPNYFSFNDFYSPATPYGSAINVSGQTGVITDINVTLTGFSHTSFADVDVLIVSPNGKGLVVMSDVSSGVVSNVNLTFDDAATSNLPFPVTSGTYRPIDNFSDNDFFPSPAPLPPYHANNAGLNNFNGFSPNGEWRLFVIDDNQSNAGTISGGWSIDITTAPPTIPPLSCSGPSFSPTSFAVGANPTNMAIADFNNDMKADVAVTNQASNDVSVLLGNGNGTFGAQTVFAAGQGAYSIVAGKFNGDNNFDLAIANSGGNNVSILLGNGNGTFSAPTNFSAGVNPISIASADFNNDMKADLAVANFGGFFFGTVSILLGNGMGSFTTGTPVRTRTQPSFVTTADFNNDGNQDLIVTSFGADSVSTFTGNGNGVFLLRQNLITNAGPVSIEVADFGTDGFLDFAVANYNFDNIRIYSGTSTGDFLSSGSQSVGTNPISVTSGDYTNTGTKNVAVALSGANAVSIPNLLGSPVAVGLFPNAVETADFNEDGKPDMISANSGTNDVSVLINSCLAAKGNLYDYNGDRKTDYSVFRPSTNGYFVQSLNSNGPFKTFGRPNDTLLPADFDGDRRTDFGFYRPESGLWFVSDRFNGTTHFLQFGLPNDIPTPADFDGDVKADIAVFRPSEGTWYIRRSTNNALQITQFGANGDKPVAADFDGDDKADIAVYRPSTGVWYILRSSDGQVFIRQFGIAEDKTVAADYDGDGKADIAVWRPSTAVWYILESSDEDFRAVAWGLPTDIPLIGDYEGDGKFDYAVFRPSDRTWYIQKSSDGGAIGFQWGVATDYPLPNAFVR